MFDKTLLLLLNRMGLGCFCLCVKSVMSSCILNLFTQLTTGCFVNIFEVCILCERKRYLPNTLDRLQYFRYHDNLEKLGARCTFISSTCECEYLLNMEFFVALIQITCCFFTLSQNVYRLHVYSKHLNAYASLIIMRSSLAYFCLCSLVFSAFHFALSRGSQYTVRIN